MNLKTHSGYPEVRITQAKDGSFNWASKILAADGGVLASEDGSSATYEEARAEGVNWKTSISDDYLLPAQTEE